MRSCRTASLIGSLGLLILGAIGACREPATFDIPPVTTALAPPASGASAPRGVLDASAEDASASSYFAAATAAEAPFTARFVDAPAPMGAASCVGTFIAVAKGKVTALGETLVVGDVLVIKNQEPFKLEGTGLVVVATSTMPPCPQTAPLLPEKHVVRASAAAELRWAKGTMAAHLDVGAKASPDLYLGRLEGTAGVPEHMHPGTWEILAAVDAHGTFVLDGTEGHLGPKQIVMVPPGAKHAWKPDPGTKLVAVQMYSPPGPEQRFVALAAAEKDAGARDAR